MDEGNQYDDTNFKTLNVVLNSISLFSTLLLAIILIVLRFKLNRRAKWLTYRTLFYIILIIVSTYIFLSILFLLQSYILIPCKVSDFLIIWLYNQTTFLATTISFFLLFRRFNPSLYYSLIPIFLALTSGIISIIFDPYNATENECWYTSDSYVPKDYIASIALFIVPQLLCISFNIGTLIYFLFAKSNITNQVPVSFILYPLIPFFSQIGGIICQVCFYAHLSWNESLTWYALVSNGLAGLLMLILFFMGPLLWVNIRRWKKNHKINLLFWSFQKKNFNRKDRDDDESDINSKSDITLNHCYHQPEIVLYQSSPSASMNNKINQPDLSQKNEKKVDLLKLPPTSLRLEEADLVDMFAKTGPQGLTIDITSNSLSSQATTIAVSPTSPKILAPICYEMEDAIPWHVVEANESEDEEDDNESEDIIVYKQEDLILHQVTPPPAALLHSSKRYSNVPPPRTSSSTIRTNHSSTYYNYRKESWLTIHDDDLDDDQHHSPHHDDENQSSHSLSQWLTKRGDSLDMVREQVGRTSKSIRRWCKQQQQLNNGQDLTLSFSLENIEKSNNELSLLSSPSHMVLHVVQEE
ncbi:unnamed protein product [Cunninghamella blakesleeana]